VLVGGTDVLVGVAVGGIAVLVGVAVRVGVLVGVAVRVGVAVGSVETYSNAPISGLAPEGTVWPR